MDHRRNILRTCNSGEPLQTVSKAYSALQLSLTALYSFDRHYYRHVPIFEASPSIDVLYRNSPLLFWTIILVACRYHPSYGLDSTMLNTPYKELLGSNLVQTISTVQSIQALIIICMWPIPTLRYSDDPSWNLCGIAMNAAMQLGLHKPEHVQVLYGFGSSNVVKTSIRTRTLTWLALFQTCTWYLLCSHPQRID